MNPVQTGNQVFEVIQQVKMAAPAYCTNFFPVQSKLQKWIDHGELAVEPHDEAAFFLRKDRDFWHFYYCAASVPVLQKGLVNLHSLKTEPVVTDLVGDEKSLDLVRPALEVAGFRHYTQLQRLARMSQPQREATAKPDASVDFAEKADCGAVLALIEGAFDHYGEQLPMAYEIETAIGNRQVLAAKHNGMLAGLLFFETQGFTSAIRFWAVAEQLRDLHCGSALIRRYFETQSAVRRFTLWVNAANENAIQKYQHYGYAPDGLIDYVLANELIHQ